MHKLEKLVLETYGKVLNEIEEETTRSWENLPKEQRVSLTVRYGEPKFNGQHDFLSSDGETYFRATEKNTTTGSISHKVIPLPSFGSMYSNFSDIVQDLKKLMRSDDVRKDAAARELFELIKTNFRKLQRYLRTERPEQYQLMRLRRSLEESLSELKRIPIVAEAKLFEEEPKPEEDGDKTASKETILEDATDIILGKFPTLKTAIVKLQTNQFKEFVTSIDWISPRPSSFRVNIKNGQSYILKWTGTGFEAQILGKRYYIDKIDDYQQALDKLSRLYREGPMSNSGEAESAETDTGSSGGSGGGDFPSGDSGGGEADAGVDALSGDAPADDTGGADLGGEPIDFEEPAEDPEA